MFVSYTSKIIMGTKNKHACSSEFHQTILVFFSLFLFGIVSTYAQQWQWVKTAGGPAGVNTSQINDGANDIEVANNSNLLITGFFNGIGVFDTVSITGSGLSNAFIARYDSLGNVIWAHGVLGGNVKAISVKENSVGDIFLLGQFSDSAIFESDTTVVTGSYSWQSEIFLAKYDALGNFLWAKKTGVNTQSNHTPVEMEINDQDDVYLSARVNGPVQLDTILISNPSGNTLLAKFNANGDALWAKIIIDNGNETLWDMSLDQSSNVFINGVFQYNMVINGNYILGSNTSDPFIMKFDSNGNFNWVQLGTGISNNWAYSIDVSFDGSIYVSGTFDGTLYFDSVSITSDAYYDDIFILKLDTSGNEEWIKSIYGNGVLEPYDLVSDQFGNFYVSGLFWDTAQVDNVQLTVGVPWVGNTYVASYQSDGSLNWATQAGDTNGNRELYTRSLALEECGGLLTAGRIKQTASFDNLNISSYGLDDAFFAYVSNNVSRSISGITVLCPGDSTQLVAIGGANYLWLPDSVYGNQFTATPDSTTFYYITGTACDGNTFLDSIEIIVLHQDSIAPSIHVCYGDSALILGAFRDTSGVYEQTFVSSFGCDSTFSQELIISNFSVTILGNDTICANDSILIFGDTVSASGTYTDTLSSALGCDSVVQKTLVMNPIFSDTLPTDTICIGQYAIIFGDTQFVSGIYIDTLYTIAGCDSVLFKTLVVDTLDTTLTIVGSQISSNQIDATYQWLDCVSGAISGQTSQTFQPTVSGDYAVEIGYLDCTDTSSCYYVYVVGIEELSPNISMYPNPAHDWLFINNSGEGPVELEMYNSVGQLVIKQESIDKGITNVSTKNLVSGIYIALVKSNGSLVRKKMVVISR